MNFGDKLTELMGEGKVFVNPYLCKSVIDYYKAQSTKVIYYRELNKYVIVYEQNSELIDYLLSVDFGKSIVFRSRDDRYKLSFTLSVYNNDLLGRIRTIVGEIEDTYDVFITTDLKGKTSFIYNKYLTLEQIDILLTEIGERIGDHSLLSREKTYHTGLSVPIYDNCVENTLVPLKSRLSQLVKFADWNLNNLFYSGEQINLLWGNLSHYSPQIFYSKCKPDGREHIQYYREYVVDSHRIVQFDEFCEYLRGLGYRRQTISGVTRWVKSDGEIEGGEVEIEVKSADSKVYLIREREFMKTTESVYKIGKTRQKGNKRFTQYPKGSELILLCICTDCDKAEKDLIKTFDKEFKRRWDIGKEYFEGPVDKMKEIITNYVVDDIGSEEALVYDKDNGDLNKPLSPRKIEGVDAIADYAKLFDPKGKYCSDYYKEYKKVYSSKKTKVQFEDQIKALGFKKAKDKRKDIWTS